MSQFAYCSFCNFHVHFVHEGSISFRCRFGCPSEAYTLTIVMFEDVTQRNFSPIALQRNRRSFARKHEFRNLLVDFQNIWSILGRLFSCQTIRKITTLFSPYFNKAKLPIALSVTLTQGRILEISLRSLYRYQK